MKTKLARQLGNVDWDFPVEVQATLGAIHWYPGTFAAGLPAALIEALSSPGQVVFDPYGGIGTTAMEAVRLGRRGWNVDLNPPALLASYSSAGLMLLRCTEAESLGIVFETVEAWLQALFPQELGAPWLGLPHPRPGAVDQLLGELMTPPPEAVLRCLLSRGDGPNSAALARWLEPSVLACVKRILRELINADLDAFCKVLALTMLSAILRSVSSQTRSWGHIADNVYPRALISKDVAGSCLRWLRRTRAVSRRVSFSNVPRTGKEWFRMDLLAWTRPVPQDCSTEATLMITSPPYAGAIDYALSQRLTLYMLGYADTELEALSRRELGARRKRFSKGHICAWAKGITQALEQQVARVQPGGYVCLIMPHKDAGREIGAQLVEARMYELGWRSFFEMDRSIRQARARQSWTSIKKEIVQVYRRT